MHVGLGLHLVDYQRSAARSTRQPSQQLTTIGSPTRRICSVRAGPDTSPDVQHRRRRQSQRTGARRAHAGVDAADHRIVHTWSPTCLPAAGISDRVDRLLDHPEVAEVHGRNWTRGCYAFARPTP